MSDTHPGEVSERMEEGRDGEGGEADHILFNDKSPSQERGDPQNTSGGDRAAADDSFHGQEVEAEEQVERSGSVARIGSEIAQPKLTDKQDGNEEESDPLEDSLLAERPSDVMNRQETSDGEKGSPSEEVEGQDTTVKSPADEHQEGEDSSHAAPADDGENGGVEESVVDAEQQDATAPPTTVTNMTELELNTPIPAENVEVNVEQAAAATEGLLGQNFNTSATAANIEAPEDTEDHEDEDEDCEQEAELVQQHSNLDQTPEVQGSDLPPECEEDTVADMDQSDSAPAEMTGQDNVEGSPQQNCDQEADMDQDDSVPTEMKYQDADGDSLVHDGEEGAEADIDRTDSVPVVKEAPAVEDSVVEEQDGRSLSVEPSMAGEIGSVHGDSTEDGHEVVDATDQLNQESGDQVLNGEGYVSNDATPVQADSEESENADRKNTQPEQEVVDHADEKSSVCIVDEAREHAESSDLVPMAAERKHDVQHDAAAESSPGAQPSVRSDSTTSPASQKPEADPAHVQTTKKRGIAPRKARFPISKPVAEPQAPAQTKYGSQQEQGDVHSNKQIENHEPNKQISILKITSQGSSRSIGRFLGEPVVKHRDEVRPVDAPKEEGLIPKIRLTFAEPYKLRPAAEIKPVMPVSITKVSDRVAALRNEHQHVEIPDTPSPSSGPVLINNGQCVRGDDVSTSRENLHLGSSRESLQLVSSSRESLNLLDVRGSEEADANMSPDSRQHHCPTMHQFADTSPVPVPPADSNPLFDMIDRRVAKGQPDDLPTKVAKMQDIEVVKQSPPQKELHSSPSTSLHVTAKHVEKEQAGHSRDVQGVREDSIMAGLKKKRDEIEGRISALQAQVMDALTSGDVASLADTNVLVENLLQMRSHISTAIMHQEQLQTAPPMSSHGALPQAHEDAAQSAGPIPQKYHQEDTLAALRPSVKKAPQGAHVGDGDGSFEHARVRRGGSDEVVVPQQKAGKVKQQERRLGHASRQSPPEKENNGGKIDRIFAPVSWQSTYKPGKSRTLSEIAPKRIAPLGAKRQTPDPHQGTVTSRSEVTELKPRPPVGKPHAPTSVHRRISNSAPTGDVGDVNEDGLMPVRGGKVKARGGFLERAGGAAVEKVKYTVGMKDKVTYKIGRDVGAAAVERAEKIAATERARAADRETRVISQVIRNQVEFERKYAPAREPAGNASGMHGRQGRFGMGDGGVQACLRGGN